jgi:two-component sensor histidine kinase
MQSARNVQSEETRLHLANAHQRVMSVAQLQKQLAASSLDDVGMRTYLTNLCQSIGASMIADHDNFSLTVRADESTLTADASVSIGLIVTELVINALKHAFSDQAAGNIFVDYHSMGSKWTLTVTDNGIGMPIGPETKKAGLGTSIVQALAAQLGAVIAVSDAHPGTEISVSQVETSSQQATLPNAV